MFSGASDGIIRKWDMSGATVASLRGHSKRIRALILTKDDRWLFSCCNDKTIRVWPSDGTAAQRVLSGHTDYVNDAEVLEDGDDPLLFSASDDGTVGKWNWRTGKLLDQFKGHKLQVKSVCISAGYVFSGSNDKTARQWSLSGDEIRVFKGHTGRLTSVKATSSTLFTASLDHSVRVWDISTGRPLRVLKEHSADVYAICLSPDSRWLFSSSFDKTIKQYDAVSYECIRTFTGKHAAAVG